MRAAALAASLADPPTPGSWSVWFGPAVGEPWLAHDAVVPHYAASTIKLPLVTAAFRLADQGALDLDHRVLVHDDFGSATGRSRFVMSRDYDNDEQVWDRLGESVPLRWLAARAVVRSSNLATNLLLEVVGADAVRATLDALGAHDSTLTRGIEDAAAAEAGLTNIVTAADLAGILRALLAGTAASPEACAEVIEILSAQEFRDTIPAGLPPGTRVAHKSGWVEGVAHDAAIVFPDAGEPFVLVVCTTSELDEEGGRRFVADVARAAWQDRQDGQDGLAGNDGEETR